MLNEEKKINAHYVLDGIPFCSDISFKCSQNSWFSILITSWLDNFVMENFKFTYEVLRYAYIIMHSTGWPLAKNMFQQFHYYIPQIPFSSVELQFISKNSNSKDSILIPIVPLNSNLKNSIRKIPLNSKYSNLILAQF